MKSLGNLLFLVSFAASTLAAAQPAAPDDDVGCQTADAVFTAETIVENAVQRERASTPALVENQASVQSGTTSSPVDGASRTNLIALAFDSGVVNSEGGVTTVSLAPLFDVIAMRDPSVVSNQRKYQNYEWARQLGLKITSGGTGDAFDRDGDGTVDDALTSTSPSDIVTYEISWQFGSRDRRDPSNFRTMLDETVQERTNLENAKSVTANLVIAAVREEPSLDKLSCEDLAAALLRKPEFRTSLQALYKMAGPQFDKAVARAAEKVDSKLIVRLVATGTERKEKFGGDKRSFGIRLSKGLADISNGGSNWDFQLDYLRNELPSGGDELEGWKLGTKYTATWLRDSNWFGSKGLLFSAGGSVEKYSDAPPDTHDSIARLDLTWSFNVGDKALVPLSITWANHTDLLEDKKDVIAHVGYSFDFDAFFSGAPHK